MMDPSKFRVEQVWQLLDYWYSCQEDVKIKVPFQFIIITKAEGAET